MTGVRESNIKELPLIAKGKVREIYDMGDNILIVSSDRISAFDVVFDEVIPQKGQVLNKMAAFWFDLTKDIVPNHMVTTDINDLPEELKKYRDMLEGRFTIAKKLKMVEAECIVRGYLEGSALKEYKNTGTVAGVKMPEGLVQGDKLPEPIFTPSTKAIDGHDINITYDELVEEIGIDLAEQLKEKSLELYKVIEEYARAKGIILADTKLEFGMDNGCLTVGDEMFTPDSSRFWDASEYEPGKAQKSFDKQYLREYLETLDWDKEPPAPKLPDEVVANTARKYKEAYEKLTGRLLED